MFIPSQPFNEDTQNQHIQEIIDKASEKYPDMPIKEAIKKIYEESVTNNNE